MPLGDSLGMEARVEPELDESSARRLERDLKDRVAAAETVEPEVAGGGGGFGGGFGARTTPTAGGGGGLGPGAGVLATKGAGRAGSLVGGASAATLGGAAVVLGTVFLGGVLANRMLDAMSAASGRLQASTSMLKQAWNLFWKPFGDALGKTILPFAKAALKMAVQFNKIADDQGLTVAVGWLASEVESSLAEAIADEVGTFGQPSDPRNVGGPGDTGGRTGPGGGAGFVEAMGNIGQQFLAQFEGFTWHDFVDPLNWFVWIDEFVWDPWITPLDLRDFVTGVDLRDFIDGPGGGGDFRTPGGFGTTGGPGDAGGMTGGDSTPGGGFPGFEPDLTPQGTGEGSETLAQGGIVTRPTTARVGEAGPEAVVPLDDVGGDSREVARKLDRLIQVIEAQTDVLRQEFDVTVQSELSVDRRTLAETVERTRAELLPSTDTRTQ